MKRWAPTQRITPAWAGKSRRRMTSWGGVLDHPRVGGEKAANFRAVCGPRGSPPRGRGKGSHAAPVIGTGGITPA